MNKDVISGLTLLVFAGGYYWSARQIPHTTLDDAFGARGLPNILAVLLAMLALSILVRGVLAARRTSPAAEDDRIDHEASLPRALGLLMFGIGYIVLLPIVGYPVALTFLIAAIAFYEGAMRDWRLAAIAVFGGVLFWLLFNKLLGVGLPSGMFF